MRRPKKTAAEILTDQDARRAFNPVAAMQSISEQQETPEFRANLVKLRAERLAREAKSRE